MSDSRDSRPDYSGPWFCTTCNRQLGESEGSCRLCHPNITRDALLHEIARSLRATHPELAEQLIAAVEKAMPAGLLRVVAQVGCYESHPECLCCIALSEARDLLGVKASATPAKSAPSTP